MKTYLALGDSYSIGEQVSITESFPYQTVQMIRKPLRFENNAVHSAMAAPEIIAKTGWTTDELDVAIQEHVFLSRYDYVSLLIGVNNQYRGRPVSSFATEFEHLLQLAIQFSGNHPGLVYVLSIPDWGVTPFASDRDRNAIAAEIDAYNMVCESAAKKFKAHYIDITISQRLDGMKDEFLAADKLHPSAREYAKWAGKLSSMILQSFSK